MRSSVFWDIMPCSPLKVKRRSARKCRLHLEGQRISQARRELKPEDGYVPLKRRLTFNGIHGFIYQKIEFFLLGKFPFFLCFET
jgi:hypothetical protein